MTPQDILRELRDIHLPDPPAAERLGLAWEPFALLAVVIAAAVLAGWLRRTRWRRDARRALRASARIRPAAAQWPVLLDLLGRSAPFAGPALPPDCIFLPPDRIGDAEVRALRAHIDRIIAR